jgi:hypothetical protein
MPQEPPVWRFCNWEWLEAPKLKLRLNRKGQFSIIAALLVAVVLVAATMATYSTIRYSPIQEQSQILSAVDETNLGLKEILGFTVGYYGSVLKVTGNQTYAQQLSRNYLQSGLNKIVDVRPEWGTSVDLTNLDLKTDWFSNESYSQGTMTVEYNLNGLGISGATYSTSTRLDVHISKANQTNQAQLKIQMDDGQPLINLGKSNLQFCRYNNQSSSWELVEPSNIASYIDGTYVIDLPTGLLADSYLIQVQDTRGLMVMASSFSSYVSTIAWNASSFQPGLDYVDTANLDVTGAHSNFAAQQNGPDTVCDALTEAANGTTLVPAYPTNYALLGSTMASGSTSDLQTNDGVYMSFHAYASGFSGSATFGNSSIGGASQSIETSVRGSSFNIPESGQAQNISVYLDLTGGASNRKVKAAIYSDAHDFIAGTEEKTVSSSGWYNFSFADPKPILLANINYVLVAWADSGSGAVSLHYFVGTSNQGHSRNLNYGNWPNQGNFNHDNNKYSIYCNYIPANQQTAQVEFTGNSPTPFPWNNLVWTTDSSSPQSGVTATFQLYNSVTGQYSTSGDGYIPVDLAAGDSTKQQNIAINPSTFVNSTGYWKVLVTACRASSTPFDLNVDILQYSPDATNYALNLQEQWLSVNASNIRQDLCIKTGVLGNESLLVQILHGISWWDLMTLVPNSFNNISLAQYIDSATLTIRFLGSSETADPTQDTWNIDAVYLKDEPDINFLVNLQQSTFTLEVLQNGTMRWLGQNMQTTTQALPIPPLPVKAIHINETIAGVNQEVPFQIEDWASDYRIPLGLTSNTTVFNNRQMIVFLLNSKVSNFTIWWDGSDSATQTPKAFTNKYFTNDNTATSTLTNGNITLQFGSGNVKSTVTGTSTYSTANFMRVNQEASAYGAGFAYVIHHGIVRDIVQQEAEWSGGISETLYVDSYNDTNTQWTETGASPYLNDNDANRISINVNNAVEGWFGFQDLSVNTFAGLKIQFECSCSGDDYIQFQLSDGVSTYGWFDVKNLPSAYGWVSCDLSSVISSIDQLNNLKVNIRYMQAGGTASTINVRRCNLEVVTAPNLYANMVLTLPANSNYYTYQLRLMFINSTQARTIKDLSPIQLTTSLTSPQTQTENGTLGGFPNLQNGTGTFSNYTSGSWTAHHFSQFISDTGKGAGIMFTDVANQKLYAFDSFSGSSSKGALKVSSGLLELLPVGSPQVQFTCAYDITWQGAVATFDGVNQVCSLYDGTTPTGLWILSEYPPTLNVTPQN